MEGTSPVERQAPPVAEVVVLPAIPDRETFSYEIPDHFAGSVRPGARVLVPLGRRRVTGIVLGTGPRPASIALKPVLDVLDEEPLLTEELLTLCRFAATYYVASIGEVFETAVLAGLRAESHRTVRLVDEKGGTTNGFGRVERRVLERLRLGRAVRVTTLARQLGSGSLYETLRSLAAKGVVELGEEAPHTEARARMESVFLVRRALEAKELEQLRRRAPVQSRILERIQAAGPEGVSSAGLGAPSTRRALRLLLKAGLVRETHREVYRPVVESGEVRQSALSPTRAQERAISAIQAGVREERFETFLLYGVTGSGKTEVYLQTAERVLASGRGVLILVPEIALTPTLVERVSARFGGTAALLHSALSAGERWDEWRRLRRGEARIAIGVRSAVFAPVPDLGLIVVDEEHDGSYKQDEGLPYNARDLAIVRARNASCPVVLGSATPSIESYWNGRSGRYRLLELGERVERRPLPSIDLIDLRAERGDQPRQILAPRLAEALQENFAARRQSLLFLNRRGFANYLQCRLCGHVVGCPNCSVTLTFHRGARLIRCHHCDHCAPAPDFCPECTGATLHDVGVGTEQLESVVRELIPDARVARMDRDTVRRRGSLQRLLADWGAHRIDLLIGTQMIAKGHDVPNVTFVGVVLADQLLNFPDFRAAERTFQMLTQVAGRSGRGRDPGRVLIQTYRPDHYALSLARTQDFPAFVEQEIRYRQALDYPPFSRLVNIRLDDPDPGRVETTARKLGDRLRARAARTGGDPHVRVLGPAPAPLERIRGRHRWHVILKATEPRRLRRTITSALEDLRSGAKGAGVRIVVDVDPYGML